MNESYLNAIRGFEGMTASGIWDYKQVSNGYGTKAKYAGEVIDEAEACRRFETEINDALATVKKFAPGLDEGSQAALTSLTFNAGSGWMSSGLGVAIREGDLARAKSILLEYTNAGGNCLPGLVLRRLTEAQWLGTAPEASTAAETTSWAPVLKTSEAGQSARQEAGRIEPASLMASIEQDAHAKAVPGLPQLEDLFSEILAAITQNAEAIQRALQGSRLKAESYPHAIPDSQRDMFR